jgi:hypothetical protein
MGNTVLEKESIEHCGYTGMFTFLSGFMGISSTPQHRRTEYICLIAVPNRLGPVGAVQADGLWERLQREDVDAFHYCGFASVGFRDGDSF